MAGIAPRVLFEQVQSTAAWSLKGAIDRETSFRNAFDDMEALERAHATEPQGRDFFRAMLAAHFCTVATFVPTDVDARIRHHAFVAMDADALAAACDVIDEAAGWNVSLVSARIGRDIAGHETSGHDGEWFAVRAGALGRAIAIGHDAIVARLSAAIDAELAREHAIVTSKLDALDLLRVSTIVAHNLGDLSRVVDAWPQKPEFAALRAQYTRLGHAPSARFGDAFSRAGALNKAVMADENHRFLPLRKPRALRGSRDLLLPIGPFFDDWGRTMATHPALEPSDRAEVVEALLAIHASRPEQRGCLRALAAIDGSTSRGLVAFESMLPARMRKSISAGPVRDAIKTPREAFEARMRKLVTRS